MPPMAGLQLICPIEFLSIVTSAVRAPMRAAMCAASQPACPPPITMTSKTFLLMLTLLAKKPVVSLNFFRRNIPTLVCRGRQQEGTESSPIYPPPNPSQTWLDSTTQWLNGVWTFRSRASWMHRPTQGEYQVGKEDLSPLASEGSTHRRRG